jgi:hypothetical protein
VVDDFTAATSGTLAGATPDTVNTPGNTWTAYQFTFNASGEVVGVSGGSRANIEVEQSNYEVEMEVSGASGAFVALNIRANLPADSGSIATMYYGMYIGGNYECGYLNASDYPWYTDGSLGLAASTYHTLKVTVVGDAVSYYANGTLVFSHTQTYRTTETRVGFEVGFGSATIRKFTVRPL